MKKFLSAALITMIFLTVSCEDGKKSERNQSISDVDNNLSSSDKDILNDNETVDKETADLENSDIESSDEEVQDTEQPDTESTDSQINDSESQDNENSDNEIEDAEVTDSESTDSEIVDVENTDTETGDSETQDSETGDSETGDTETGDSETGDSETSDIETTDSVNIDAETDDSETSDFEISDEEFHDSDAADDDISDADVDSDEETDYDIPDFFPENIRFDENGIVYILSRVKKSIFRWDSKSRKYLNPITIRGLKSKNDRILSGFDYSKKTSSLYIAYLDGEITRIPVDLTSGETFFAQTHSSLCGVAAVGDFILAQDTGSSNYRHYIFSTDGVLKDTNYGSLYSMTYTWSPIYNRVYFFKQHRSPQSLSYEEIDNESGEIVKYESFPYHADYKIKYPIRVSNDGKSVILGTGDIFNAESLEAENFINTSFLDSVWMKDEGIITIRKSGENCIVERRDSKRKLIENRIFEGQPLRILDMGDKYLVITHYDDRAKFNFYTPNNDSDGDGFKNVEDDFPNDPSASQDSDRDGYPDNWNVGKNQTDSTTGLELDAFPNDSVCYTLDHGYEGVCEIYEKIPKFIPDKIFTDKSGIVYLFSKAFNKIFRWDPVNWKYINPINTGILPLEERKTPVSITYSSDINRIYLGYEDGEVTFISLDKYYEENPFAVVSEKPETIVAFGDFALVVDYIRNGSYHKYRKNRFFSHDGNFIHMEKGGSYSSTYKWDSSRNRLYILNGSYSLKYEHIDSESGNVIDSKSGKVVNTSKVKPLLRVSSDGEKLIVGNGDVYDANTLEIKYSGNSKITDAIWTENNGLVTIRTYRKNTLVERRNNSLKIIERLTVPGEAIKIISNNGNYVIISKNEDSILFSSYVPSNDTDGDGVDNWDDAFPNDPAASVDSDLDGYPDKWNEGKTSEDSTTGLEIDSYPNDSECYLPEHGDGTECDIESNIPEFVPDKVLIDKNGIVYLFKKLWKKLYRWDSESETFLRPINLRNIPLDTGTGPEFFDYSEDDERLYFAYDRDKVTAISILDPKKETTLFNTRYNIYHFSAEKDFFFTVKDDRYGHAGSKMIYDKNGELINTLTKSNRHYEDGFIYSEGRIYYSL